MMVQTAKFYLTPAKTNDCNAIKEASDEGMVIGVLLQSHMPTSQRHEIFTRGMQVRVLITCGKG